MQDVAIFWDYENCSPPSNASGYIIANNIRLMAQAYGSVKSLRAYLEITDQVSSARALALRSEFQASGVSLIDCPHNGRKEVADKMIIGKQLIIEARIHTGRNLVDMLAYAIDNPAPSVIVLISGDRDFAYALSILRLRKYQIILVTLSNAHPSLTLQASACIDWHSTIINPVIQPSSRTTSNPVESVTRTIAYRDSLPAQSPPSRSSPPQSSLSQSLQYSQEVEKIGQADHGDLLHYLRASTSVRPRRPSEVPFFSIGQQARNETPRQDASPSIEVELRYTRPGPSNKSTPDLMDSSISNNSLATGVILDPVQNRVSTLPSGIKDAMAGATDGQPSFFSLSSNMQPFLTSLSNIDNSIAPTLLPSIMQETPPHSPLPQYTFLETDIPKDDSTRDLPFIYPMRPASAPHSLPSQSPLVPVIFVAEPESPNSEALSILIDSSADQSDQYIPASQEAPRQLVSPPVDLSDASIAISEETLNNDQAPPDIESINQSDPFITFDSGVHQPTAMSLENQISSPFTNLRNIIDGPPSTTDSINQAETRIPNTRSVVNKPPVLPSAIDILSKPEVAVPSVFKILVETLQIQKAKGYSRPLQSFVAETMYKNGFTYENTGVTSFGQYAALCEKKGIIESGGSTGGAEWISLKSDYENAFKPAAPVVPPIFKLLVQAIKIQESKGFNHASRAVVAYTMYKSGFVYKDAGVNKFAQYAALAEKQGIVELGGDGDGWISLTPKYREIPMSQIS